MKIIRGIDNLNNEFTQCVLTLGNFDGVHLGHQQLINHLIEQGKKLNLPTAVMLFEPQPLEFFSKRAPTRLTSFKEKVRLYYCSTLYPNFCQYVSQCIYSRLVD